MQREFLAALTAFLMLAMATVPGAGADPEGDVEYAQGPSYVHVKDVLQVGVPCTDRVPFLECDSQPGALAPPQAARFDVTAWNSDPANTGSREVTVWARQISGLWVNGFSLSACSDRDDDDVCSQPVDDVSEQGYSNRAVSGDEPCSKDDKDCPDPTDASVTFCVREDMLGGYDEVVAFIGNWADVGLGGNIGAGVSMGTYEVYLQANAFGC